MSNSVELAVDSHRDSLVDLSLEKEAASLELEPTLPTLSRLDFSFLPSSSFALDDEQQSFSCDDSISALHLLGFNEFAVSSPLIASVDPPFSSPMHSFSLLPAHLVGESLAVWDFFTTFSLIFQLPQISYEAFEYSLCHPALSGVVEQMMTIVLLVLFAQLKAVLSRQDKIFSVHGWKPFQGYAFHCLAWPELARILFICYKWSSTGQDVKNILRCFLADGKKGIDTMMHADPIELVSMEDSCESIEDQLSISDCLYFSRSRALVKYLLSIEAFQPLHESPEVGLIQLNKQLESGAFCSDTHFDLEAFRARLALVWNSAIAPADLLSHFREVAERLYRLWVLTAPEGQRGPWDEVDRLSQPCKLCWECGIETENTDACVTCDRCLVSFHFTCLTPPLVERPPEGWLCGFCRGNKRQNEWKAPQCDEMNVSVISPITRGYYPLLPLMGARSSLKYDIDRQFDPCVISPAFFGYVVTTSSSDTELLLTPTASRAHQLAKLLATSNPAEMKIENRLAIVATVAAIARDYPLVRQESEEAERTMHSIRSRLQMVQDELIEQSRQLCKLLLDSLRGGLDSWKAKEESRMSSRAEFVETPLLHVQTSSKGNRQGNWTSSEIDTLKEAVIMMGTENWTKIAENYGDRLGNRSCSGRSLWLVRL